MNEQVPLPWWVAAWGEIRCIINTARLLARRRVHLPRKHVGMRLRFADGTSAHVYRETVVDRTPTSPCVLVVEFRLAFLRGAWAHALFRWESLLNTPLFVGFPGFVSKLWLTHDQHNVYRGLYEWDGPERAAHYTRSLWWVLAIGCEPTTIHYWVLPGMRRDEVLAAPQLLDTASGAAGAWWRPVEVAA